MSVITLERQRTWQASIIGARDALDTIMAFTTLPRAESTEAYKERMGHLKSAVHVYKDRVANIRMVLEDEAYDPALIVSGLCFDSLQTDPDDEHHSNASRDNIARLIQIARENWIE